MNDHSAPSVHNLRILSVSDYVDKDLNARIETGGLGPVDLVLSCGDLPPEYLSFLRNRLDCPLFYVKGNHDIRYTAHNPVGCRNLHGRMTRFNTLNIAGFEGSMWYNGGMNQYTEKMMRKKLFSFNFLPWPWPKKKIHIVITHAPPRHIHDGKDLCHRGFECFTRFIEKRTPDVFIHGHIHKAFDNPEERTTFYHKTKVINTCGHHLFEV